MERLLTARFDEALVFASRLHADQKKKGTEVPYVSHLLGVCSIVLVNGGDENEAIAALLHDAVEDQGGAATRAAIASRFGEAVATIVDGCTDTDTIPKPEWRPRKEAYVAHLADATRSVLLVSSADKLYNARSIVHDYRELGDRLWDKFKGGRDGTLWYYRALVDAYRAKCVTPIVEELDRTVSEMERLAS